MSHGTSLYGPEFLFDNEQIALLDTKSAEPGVVLSGKPCEILSFLIASPDTVLSVAEIQHGVWGNIIVTNGSVKDYIAQIRAALNDCATKPRFIETVRGRGYRYLGGIKILATRPEHMALQATLAIIPPMFAENKNHPHEMLGEIVAANLIDSVSRSPLINIISRLSTRQFKNANTNLQKIGRTLGADYLLSGLYHYQKDQLVLFLELSHVSGANVVWAEKMGGSVSDWSDENGDHMQQLAQVVTNEIVQHQIELTTSEPIQRLALHTLIIKAITFMHSSSQTVFHRAEEMLMQSSAKLPNNATVYSLLAQWHLMSMNRSRGWTLSGSAKFRDNAFRCAEQALQINPLHAHANTIIGSLEARLNNEFSKALDHHNTAMNSNPNSALNHCFKASACTYQDGINQGKTAVYHANKAIALSPLDPQLYLFKTIAAAANLYAGNLEQARLHATESYAMNPNHTSNLRTLISILVDLQKTKEARLLKDKLMTLDPTFTIEAYDKFGPGIQSEFGQRISKNLKEAGIPVH